MKWLKSSINDGLSPETGCILQCKIYEPTNPGLHTTLLFNLIVLYFSWTIFSSIIIYNTSIILELLLKTIINQFPEINRRKAFVEEVQAHAKQNKTKTTVSPNQTNRPKKPPTHYIKKPNPNNNKKITLDTIPTV